MPPSTFILRRLRLMPNIYESVISPLEGEMSGRTEGGEPGSHHSAASLTGAGRKSSGKWLSALITG
ncbi:hypothetical protein FHU14_000256 [Mesorhizobium sp. RMAD-H1]|nr:hypothetical protein [Mesorhizobium sp. RMAD-H1]